MQRRSLLVALALATTGLTGCIGVENPLESTSGDDATAALAPDDVEVPDDATVETFDGGVRLVFENVSLPMSREIEVPEDATVVDLEAHLANESRPVYTHLGHAGTGAMRCTTPFVQGWSGAPTGTSSCAGLTAIDPAGTAWTASVSSNAGVNEEVTAERVEVDLYDVELDGIAGRVDTASLSMPHHEVGETTTHTVAGHNDTGLHVEVHRPADGHDGFPTVLISTPYNTLARATGGQPYEAFVQDFVERGYAVAIADVRGFGQSDGCVEVWGPNEQADQVELVEWITEQDFSNGKVGMLGVSYPGTTPVEAAVQAPEGLEAIVTVAGVIDAYDDWHYGGVPNGENVGSPAAYQAIGAATSPRPQAPVDTIRDAGNGLCEPALLAGANDPRAIRDAFYEVRDFATRVDQVDAAVMHQQGLVDGTVKPQMIPGWFNELDTPKLGIYGHWSHNYAVRADQAMLRLAWMDQFVKGTDVGLGNASTASVTTQAEAGAHQTGDAWPPETADATHLYPAFDEGELTDEPADVDGELVLDPTGLGEAVEPGGPSEILLEGEVEQTLAVSGQPSVRLTVGLEGAANGYVDASLFEVREDERDRLITFGSVNLAHRGDHTSYEPITPDETVTVPLQMMPTEYTLEEGDELRLELTASEATGLTRGSNPGRLVLHAGGDGTALDLPTMPADAYQPVPVTVDPSPAS